MRDSLRIDAVADGSWGEPHARTAEDNAAGAAPPCRPSARRSIPRSSNTCAPSRPATPGFIALSLDAAVLSHSAGASARFADVRVIDASARQVPYLVERASEPLSIDLRLEPAVAGALVARGAAVEAERVSRCNGRSSVCRRRASCSRPPPGLPALDHRRCRARSRPASSRSVVRGARGGRLDARRPGSPGVCALTLSLPSADARELFVLVEEGDQHAAAAGERRASCCRRIAPAVVPQRRTRRSVSPTAARISRRPTADLALLAPQLLGVAVTEVAAGAEEPSRSDRHDRAALVSPRVFWGVLAVAVLVLIVMIARCRKNATLSHALRSRTAPAWKSYAWNSAPEVARGIKWALKVHGIERAVLDLCDLVDAIARAGNPRPAAGPPRRGARRASPRSARR